MSRTFDLVDRKLEEADFFLSHLRTSDGNLFSAACYFSAFVAAARSVTFSLQSVMAHNKGFAKWYEGHQSRLKDDEYARFFHQARRLGQHVGASPLSSGYSRINERGELELFYTFQPCPDFPVVPDIDAIRACEYYLIRLVEIVFDAYRVFGRDIDPEQYYSEEAFHDRGLTIEDAEEEIIGVRGWTKGSDIPIAFRWQMLRDSMPKCQIDHLFDEYLGEVRSIPERLDPPIESIKLPKGWTRKDGWLLPPGFADLNMYLDSLRNDEDCPNNSWLEAWHKENYPNR